MRKLLITVGLPRAGKSTWAIKQWKAHGIPIVEPDAIRLALHGRKFMKEAELHVWAITRTMVEALFLAGHDTVILSATLIQRVHRDVWKSDKWIREWILFDAPLETCIERARLSEQEDLVPIIERMAARFEPIQRDEIDVTEK